MKKTKLEKGITLIALIITIVVLLILAVVTIGAIQESKIIAHAKNASSGYNDEKSKEESAISGYEALIDSKLPGGNGNSGDQEKSVPIPSGFYYVTGTKDTGFVISDNPADENNASGKSGNQFVWVPVTTEIVAYGLNTTNRREPSIITSGMGSRNMLDAVATNLNRAECEDIDKDGTLEAEDFETQLTNEFNLMAASVNKYNGFYVGRYETSKNGTKPESKYGATTAYNSSTENDWYGLYALNKKYTTSSVQGSMIWGSQYDAMMTWMGDAANTTISDYNKNRTCGTALNDVIKNVYDLYGNSYEWTLEACSGTADGRVYRGGYYNSFYMPGTRSNGYPTSTHSNTGSRLALYIV